MSDKIDEIVKNIFDLGDYPIAKIEFGPWEKIEDSDFSRCGWWPVSLRLMSCDETIPVGTCWLEGEEVSFYVEMDDLMEIVSKEVENRTQKMVLEMFGVTINSDLNVQVYGKDYT